MWKIAEETGAVGPGMQPAHTLAHLFCHTHHQHLPLVSMQPRVLSPSTLSPRYGVSYSLSLKVANSSNRPVSDLTVLGLQTRVAVSDVFT